MEGVRIARGLTDEQTIAAVGILLEAFDEKIAHELRPTSAEQAVRITAAGITPAQAWCAFAEDGSLVGLAGVAAPGRPFYHVPFGLLRDEFGLPGALQRWAYGLMEVLAHPRRRGTLRVEVLAVRADARGSGVGTALLEAIAAAARDEGAERLLLEVVDTNGRARDLYERVGFRATRTIRSGLLTAGAGYRAVHFMRLDL
jgi:ribosomal protein S18 acetylase RimI-like enzyme